MTVEMNDAVAAMLRKPFDAEEIGKLPKVTCPACRDKTKMCPEHKKKRCADCGNWISESHIHIDYVGHAETTDRFLQVDPAWNWEPLAVDGNGVPYVDAQGGMWIKLTIAGVTRLGYGHADGKRGGDAIKEAIGDALRNAGMRFGVALNLWGAKFEAAAAAEISKATAVEPVSAAEDGNPQTVDEPSDSPSVAEELVNQHQHRTMHALWRELGYAGDDNRLNRLEIIGKVLKLTAPLQTSSELTRVEADTVIEALRAKQRHNKRAAEEAAREGEAQ